MLLPFIDEERLRANVRKIPVNKFSKSELKRNESGHSLVFTYENGECDPECESTPIMEIGYEEKLFFCPDIERTAMWPCLS